jgi:hypothetical protein
MSDQTAATLDANLKRILQFTDNDLVANRQGIFSDAQQARFRHETESAKHVMFAVFFIVTIAACMFLIAAIAQPIGRYSTKSQSSTGDSGSAVACILLPLLVVGPIFFQMLKTSDDIETQKVISVKGPIKHRRYFHNRTYRFQITVGDKTFEVYKFLYDAFAKDETYILYYTFSMKLIAAERVTQLPSSPQ